MQEKVLWAGQEETNSGSDLISETLPSDQVDDVRQESSIKSSYEIGISVLVSTPGQPCRAGLFSIMVFAFFCRRKIRSFRGLVL